MPFRRPRDGSALTWTSRPLPTEDDVFLVGLTWESLGVLAFRREITLDLMGDFFSGTIVILWRKLHAFVERDRRSLKRETGLGMVPVAGGTDDRARKEIASQPSAHRDWK
jgi:hypothetical protein